MVDSEDSYSLGRSVTRRTEDSPTYLIASHHLHDTDTGIWRPTLFESQIESGDASSRQSPNTYIDELTGSDLKGIGTRQNPFQSLLGAVKARGPNSTYYFKKRFLASTNQFHIGFAMDFLLATIDIETAVPHTAIPISVGSFKTDYCLVEDAAKANALAQIKRFESPPAYDLLHSKGKCCCIV